MRMRFKLDSRKIGQLKRTCASTAVGLKDYSATTKKELIWFKKQALKCPSQVPNRKLVNEWKEKKSELAKRGIWLPFAQAAANHQLTQDGKDILDPDGKFCWSAEKLIDWMASDKKSLEFLRQHSGCHALKTYLGHMGIACLTADGIELLRSDRCFDETTDSIVHCPPGTQHFGGRALASRDVVASIPFEDDGFSTRPSQQLVPKKKEPRRHRRGIDFDDIDSVPGESTAGAAFAQYSSSDESGDDDGMYDSALPGHVRESNNHYAKQFEQYLASKDKDRKEEMDFAKDFLKYRSEDRCNEAGLVSNFLNEQRMDEIAAARTKSVTFTTPRGKSGRASGFGSRVPSHVNSDGEGVGSPMSFSSDSYAGTSATKKKKKSPLGKLMQRLSPRMTRSARKKKAEEITDEYDV